MENRLFQRFASAERSYVGRLEFNGNAGQKVGFSGGIGLKNFGDLRGGRRVGHQPKTGYDELDGDLKLEFFLSSESSLVFTHQQVDLDNAWRTHKTIFGVPWEGTTVGSEKQRTLDQKRHLTYLQYLHSSPGSFVERFKLSFSYQAQDEDRFRVLPDSRMDEQGFQVGTTGVWARLESFTAVGHWTYGFEYYRDRVDSFRRDFNADGSLRRVRIQGPVADDSSYGTLGLYAEDRISALEQLDVMLGLRYSHASTKAGRVEDPLTGDPFSLEDSWNKVMASARTVFRLQEGDRLNLFGGVAQSFRAPNLSDLTRLDTARSNEIETPAPGLRPETFLSYEAGLKASYNLWTAQVAYFYTDINQPIVRVPTGEVIEDSFEVTKKNSGNGYIQGVELDATFRLHPQLTASATFATLYGEVDTYPSSQAMMVREPLDRLFPSGGSVGLEWRNLSGTLWLGALARLSDRQDRLSTRDRRDTQRIPPGGTPGHAVFDLWGGWQLSEQVTISAELENVGNRDYRIHGSGLNEAGRNLILGLDLKF